MDDKEIKEPEEPTETTHIRETMALMMKSGFSVPDYSDKITSEHIDKLIELDTKQAEIRSKDRHEIRLYVFFGVIISLIAFITIIVLLKDQPELLEKILYIVAGLILGAFGGYGFGRARARKDDSDDE